MAKFIGRRVEAALAFETSRGVGKTPAISLGKIDFSLADKVDENRIEESFGHIADSFDKVVAEKYASGSMSGDLGSNSAAYLLGLALGSAPANGSTSDSVTAHTIALANTNQHKSGALLVKDGNETKMFKLLMLENFQISVTLDGLVKWSADFIAKAGVTSTASMPAYAEDYKFTRTKAKVKVAADVASLAAATRLSLKQFELNISKNLMRDGSIGTAEPEDILNRQFSLEGNMRLNYTDQTFKGYMLGGTKKALELVLTSAKVIGSTTYGSLTIQLPKVDFFSWEPDAAIDDVVTQQINYKANYDLTNGVIQTCTVNNAIASI